jgi:hypothetical protein
MEQLREELLASDPVEMRRRANAVLGQILAKQLDPRYRRTALDVLKRLDDQEHAAARADREAYRTAVAQMAALDTMQGSATKPERSASAKLPAKEQPRVDIDQIIADIDEIVARRQHSRELEPPAVPALESCPDEAQEAAAEGTSIQEELAVNQVVAPPASGFLWVRKPGHFGRGGWVRVPGGR